MCSCWLILWKTWFIGLKPFSFVAWFGKDVLLLSHIWFQVRIVSLLSLENHFSFILNLFNCPLHHVKTDLWFTAHSCGQQLDAQILWGRIPHGVRELGAGLRMLWWFLQVCQEFNTTWAWQLEEKGYKKMQTECKAAILKVSTLSLRFSKCVEIWSVFTFLYLTSHQNM